LIGQVVEGLLQVVELLPLVPNPLQVASSPVALIGLQRGDEKGVRPSRQVLRHNPAVPTDGSVEVGPAVAIDETHLYYAPLRAPNPVRKLLIPRSSSRS
jgi:hypothetical protein